MHENSRIRSLNPSQSEMTCMKIGNKCLVIRRIFLMARNVRCAELLHHQQMAAGDHFSAPPSPAAAAEDYTFGFRRCVECQLRVGFGIPCRRRRFFAK